MMMFESEAHLLEVIARHDHLVRECVSGKVSFSEFSRSYNNFYVFWALDGHESDEEERALLEKHGPRIEPHRIIGYQILRKVCADEDALRESYKNAGRFGSAEAVRLLSEVKLGLRFN